MQERGVVPSGIAALLDTFIPKKCDGASVAGIGGEKQWWSSRTAPRQCVLCITAMMAARNQGADSHTDSRTHRAKRPASLEDGRLYLGWQCRGNAAAQ